MAVLGELGEFDVAGILQILASRHASGLLKLTLEGDEFAIYLRNGRLVHFRSIHLPLRLGRVLQQRGLISANQLEIALRIQVEEHRKRTLGEILVAKGWVTAPQVGECRYEQHVNALSRAISAARGMFAWHSGAAVPESDGAFAIDVQKALIDAIRRIEELAPIRAALPDSHAVLAPTERIDLATVPFDTAEQRIIDALRAGVTTWAELLDLLPFDERQLMTTLGDLIRRRLVVSGMAATNGEMMSTGGPAIDEADLARLLGEPVPVAR